MKYGKFLPENGTIGFVAPSFGCNIEPYKSAFANAKKTWTDTGYSLSLGPNVYEGCGIGISNTPEKCAQEFNDWYEKEDVDVLISCGGGELMCEILEHVDFEKLRQSEPKWFMGYSDNTNLIFLLATLCDTAAIYGPCAAAFGMEPWHESLKDAMNVLTGMCKKVHNYDKWEKEGLKTEENPLVPYNVTEKFQLHTWTRETGLLSVENFNEEKLEISGHIGNTKKAESSSNLESAMGAIDSLSEKEQYVSSEISVKGRLLGGCLDCLATLCGTKFDKVAEFNEKYKEDGVLWFLEACDLNVMGIRRALWQLDAAGWFKNAKGFLIGRPYCYGEEFFGLDQYKAVVDILSKYNVPIIMDLDIGHLPPMMPLVCGSVAEARVKDNSITIDMEYK